MVMGTSAALLEEIIVKDGLISAGSFDRYPLLRMAQAPDVETSLLEAPDGKRRGLGVPSLGPIAPASANAYFAMTGVRLRCLPMMPARVKAALDSQRGALLVPYEKKRVVRLQPDHPFGLGYLLFLETDVGFAAAQE